MKYVRDDLGNRMKFYESQETSASFLKGLPLIIRLDGKAFHTFTKGLNRPYDENFSLIMKLVTQYLMKLTNAKIGYTQSDEISLLLYNDNVRSSMYFDGKKFKLMSLSGDASSKFQKLLFKYLPNKTNLNNDDSRVPAFDCRCFNVPDKNEVINYFIWRQNDCIRNSVSMLASTKFSHKKLQNKSRNDMINMLFSELNIIYDDYDPFFRNGRFIKKVKISKQLEFTDLNLLPLKHNARKQSNLVVSTNEFMDFSIKLSSLDIDDRMKYIFE